MVAEEKKMLSDCRPTSWTDFAGGYLHGVSKIPGYMYLPHLLYLLYLLCLVYLRLPLDMPTKALEHDRQRPH